MTSAADWSGHVGEVWASEWARTDRSFAGLSHALDAAILAAAPTGPGRAVDLGCGAGVTSITLASARPDLMVTGVDIAAELIAAARRRTTGLANLNFTVADLTRDIAPVEGADLLFSRHGVMFFDRPDEVFARLRAAVAPGARLVFSCFRARVLNPWAGELVAAVTGKTPLPPTGYTPGPFGFADPDWTAAMLTGAGWQVTAPQPVGYTYIAGEGTDPLTAAADFLGRIGPVSAAIKAAPAPERPAMLDRLASALAAYRDGDRVGFPAAAWVWTAHA